MFDHVKFGVSDYAASKAFFLKALEPLGVAVVSEGPMTYGVELSPRGKASLCLYQAEEKPAHLHLAFTAENRLQVEAFYRAAHRSGLPPTRGLILPLRPERDAVACDLQTPLPSF